LITFYITTSVQYISLTNQSFINSEFLHSTAVMYHHLLTIQLQWLQPPLSTH